MRDLTQIAKRYIRGHFLVDLLALIPFNEFFQTNRNELFYIIKVIRIQKGTSLLSSNSIMKQVKLLFNKRLERIVKDEPDLANNCERDNNNITMILMISYFFNIFKQVVVILTLSYFMGMFWWIYCDLTQVEEETEEQDVGFIKHFNLNLYPDTTNTTLINFQNQKNAIIVTYWAFTTLSTVGFGDYHPRSNAERGLCAFLLLFGVTIFSYIMGNYIGIVNSIKNLNADNDDGENLSRWLGLIKRFNNGRPIS